MMQRSKFSVNKIAIHQYIVYKMMMMMVKHAVEIN